MEQKNILYCTDRKQWRDWLTEHFETDREVWFVFPVKKSQEPCVSYNDAVEEALCFGWIDGQAGTLDEMHGTRRFTPRRPGSPYSRPNIERLIWLDSKGMIHPKIKPSVEEIINTQYIFPEDILEALKKDKETWENHNGFSEPYKRIRIAYIDAARKRPPEFQKRLDNYLQMTKENRLIVGYGGIDKYYK